MHVEERTYMASTDTKASILTRLRRVKHKETPKGLSLNVYIYINKGGSGTVVVNGPGGVNVPFGNIGQGIAVMAELMGAKAVVAARKKA
ncbi:MAG TPA: hypothetical protein DCK98_14610 [Chloroflexi bacterium]|jgi:site-specific DNA-adenine methylase|nr:hypothetical protein [Chloroflexota bacterium]HAL28699.1 hypothetical protein [Chloroflexota bacterium]